MREESHLEDMRDAIRGDFERLAERRGEQQLLRATEPDEPPASVPEPEPTPEQDPEPEAMDESEAPHSSWLSRLFQPH